MSNVITYQRFWMRRDTTSNWVSANPTLAAGEWGVEIDNTDPTITKFKLGDGLTAWDSLPYKGEGFPDAPIDGKIYGRKGGAWVEVTSAPSTSYRYYRISVQATQTADSFFSTISEIEMSLSPGGSNIALIMPAFASSSFSGTPASLAFDGNPATMWNSAESVPGPVTIGCDLGSQSSVAEIRIRAGDTAARALRAPSVFTVQGSNDNSTWFTLASFSGVTGWTPGQIRSFSV